MADESKDNSRLKKMEEILVQAFVAETLGNTGQQKEREQEFYELGFEGCSDIPKQIEELKTQIAAEANPEIKAVLEMKRDLYQRLYGQYTDLLNDFIE